MGIDNIDVVKDKENYENQGESLKQQIQSIFQQFAKTSKKQYLMSFLYNSDEDVQSEIIYLQFQVYYHDDLNPFQSLMPKIVRFNIIGPYPEALMDEVKYLIMMRIQTKMLLEAKKSGKDLQEVMAQKEFNESLDAEVNRQMEELFKDKNERYYMLVTTDDVEYQRELQKMMEDGSEIKIKDKKIKLVLAEFD